MECHVTDSASAVAVSWYIHLSLGTGFGFDWFKRTYTVNQTTAAANETCMSGIHCHVRPSTTRMCLLATERFADFDVRRKN